MLIGRYVVFFSSFSFVISGKRKCQKLTLDTMKSQRLKLLYFVTFSKQCLSKHIKLQQRFQLECVFFFQFGKQNGDRLEAHRFRTFTFRLRFGLCYSPNMKIATFGKRTNKRKKHKPKLINILLAYEVQTHTEQKSHTK